MTLLTEKLQIAALQLAPVERHPVRPLHAVVRVTLRLDAVELERIAPSAMGAAMGTHATENCQNVCAATGCPFSLTSTHHTSPVSGSMRREMSSYISSRVQSRAW